MDPITARKLRTAWWREARFGLFLHWGLYAIPARGEWVRKSESLSNEDYEPYFREFNPTAYDPKAWAATAKAAGMRYAVLTAKHHDGFCLFDSKLTDYKATNTPAGRDLLREFIDAFRAAGLKVGFYYSLIDWHHEDFPHYGDRHHPLRHDESLRDREHNFDRYLDYMHGQVRELCTNYGDVDIFWFDFSYDEMTGEKWRAKELVEMVRELQPMAIIDNRLEASGERAGSIRSLQPEVYAGDFASPEQIIPPRGIIDEGGNPVPWEACLTMNNNWGYAAGDKSYKTTAQLIRKLVECVSKNGNMILNVGPDATGRFPKEALEILEEMGNWMQLNDAAIYGCGAACLEKPEWGYYTRRGRMLYAHVLEAPIGPLALALPREQVVKVRLLVDGSEIKVGTPWNTLDFPGHIFINFGEPEHLTHSLPCPINTVLAIELA